MSPYVVTTRQPSAAKLRPSRVTADRRAVATLDEAHAYVKELLHGYRGSTGSDYVALRISPSGGTVGPLPDGTTISVKRISWAEVRGLGGLSPQEPFTQEQVLDAFNTRQATR